MTLTLGIDPGSRITGWGLVEKRGSGISWVDSGVIRVGAGGSRPERLMRLKRGIAEVIASRRPGAVAVERIFMAKNPRSALVLGEARGVLLLAAAEAGLDVCEYAPREVKMSVVGTGGANKSQVASMIHALIGMKREAATEDETDALAVAFCHLLRVSGPVGRLT